VDLICTTCGEPWDFYYVLHDEPESFSREGAAIVNCPCCPGKPEDLSEAQKDLLAAAKELGRLLGDDVNGYAAQLEDMGLV
jgi:hypothetical protein